MSDRSEVGADLRDAVLHDCDLSDVRILDSNLTALYVLGYGGPIVVNEVDVTAHVEAELDPQYPERVQARAVRNGSADELRAMWAARMRCHEVSGSCSGRLSAG